MNYSYSKRVFIFEVCIYIHVNNELHHLEFDFHQILSLPRIKYINHLLFGALHLYHIQKWPIHRRSSCFFSSI